jgi:large subunit ribosomal protein L24e
VIHVHAGRRAAQDATFEMERRRNRPEKYNRELVGATLAAIDKIDKIRSRRQERYYEARMRAARPGKRAAARKELVEAVHLVRAPEGLVAAAAAEKAAAAAQKAKIREKVRVAAGDLASGGAAMDMSD